MVGITINVTGSRNRPGLRTFLPPIYGRFERRAKSWNRSIFRAFQKEIREKPLSLVGVIYGENEKRLFGRDFAECILRIAITLRSLQGDGRTLKSRIFQSGDRPGEPSTEADRVFGVTLVMVRVSRSVPAETFMCALTGGIQLACWWFSSLNNLWEAVTMNLRLTRVRSLNWQIDHKACIKRSYDVAMLASRYVCGIRRGLPLRDTQIIQINEQGKNTRWFKELGQTCEPTLFVTFEIINILQIGSSEFLIWIMVIFPNTLLLVCRK
jgi:hypothetical protein